MKKGLYFALFLLFLLHNDLFLWNDECLIWGFPSGLLYHVAFCLVTSAVMLLLVKYAWPEHLEVEEEGPAK
jgi:hypothetical protein